MKRALRLLASAWLMWSAGAEPASAGIAGDQLCNAAGRSSGCLDTRWPTDSYRPPRERDDSGSNVPAGCPACRAETIRRLGHFETLQPPTWSPDDQRRDFLRSIWREEWGVGSGLAPLLAAKPPKPAPMPAPKPKPPAPSPLDPLRTKVAQTALAHVGDKDWAYARRRGLLFGPRTEKCNLFVAETLREAGAAVPNIEGRLKQYPPTAADWANPDLDIPGWSKPFKKGAKPGDVAAVPHRYADATGHTGIVVDGNMTVSANARAPVPGTIDKTRWGFRNDEDDKNVVFRRYIGTGD